jgi:MFS transporter, DHA2 family, methylenomycin A resistance protein
MSSQQASPATAGSPVKAKRTEGRLPLVALCLGFFMIMMDATVVNTALPDIGRDLMGATGSSLGRLGAGSRRQVSTLATWTLCES